MAGLILSFSCSLHVISTSARYLHSAKRRISCNRHITNAPPSWPLHRRINISIKKSNKLLVSRVVRYRAMPSNSNNPTLKYSYAKKVEFGWGGKMICVYLIYCVWIHKTIESADMLISSAFLFLFLFIFVYSDANCFSNIWFWRSVASYGNRKENMERSKQCYRTSPLLIYSSEGYHWQIYRWSTNYDELIKQKSLELWSEHCTRAKWWIVSFGQTR
jgi:hypothetical protein